MNKIFEELSNEDMKSLPPVLKMMGETGHNETAPILFSEFHCGIGVVPMDYYKPISLIVDNTEIIELLKSQNE